ncbi:MAG: hypothetical protein ACREN8_08030 [Candidatus Dormibacteraceae bacterium]
MNPLRISTIGVSIASLLALAACGGQNQSRQTVNFDVKVAGNQMTPSNKLTAHGGDTINLTVSADKAEEIHLHGYDLHFYPKPGQPQSKTFAADKTGAFEIEIEDSSTHLGELDVLPQ